MKVLVVTAGSLHLAYLGPYGNDWIETPTLDRLAVEGVVFDNHFADQPDAAGARRAWRTGQYQLPSEDTSAVPPAAAGDDLLALMRAGGVHTVLVRDPRSPVIEESQRGWDEVVEPGGEGDEHALEATVEATVDVLDRLSRAKSWLLWVDLATLLPPWQLPDEFARHYAKLRTSDAEKIEQPGLLTELPVAFLDRGDQNTWQQLQDSYAGAVTYLDAGLGQLWEDLEQRELADEVCVVATSDYGLPLGEHQMVGVHRPWLYDELVHLPLILRLPGAAEATHRVLSLTQPVDLLPTMLDLFGLPAVSRHGHSLLPLARGRLAQVRPYAVSGLRVGERVEWALRAPQWSFLMPVRQEVDDNPRPRQLYVRPDDRWELNDLMQHHLPLADHLAEVLHEFAARSKSPEAFDLPELRDVASESPENGTRDDIPEG